MTVHNLFPSKTYRINGYLEKNALPLRTHGGSKSIKPTLHAHPLQQCPQHLLSSALNGNFRTPSFQTLWAYTIELFQSSALAVAEKLESFCTIDDVRAFSVLFNICLCPRTNILVLLIGTLLGPIPSTHHNKSMMFMALILFLQQKTKCY